MNGYVLDILNLLEQVPREVWVGTGLAILVIFAYRQATKP